MPVKSAGIPEPPDDEPPMSVSNLLRLWHRLNGPDGGLYRQVHLGLGEAPMTTNVCLSYFPTPL